jgi:long-chain acyl-CoA synthetase
VTEGVRHQGSVRLGAPRGELVTKSRGEAIAVLTAPGSHFELETARVIGADMRVFAHAPTSLRDVLAQTAAFGDATFLVFEGERYTFAEHLSAVAGLATHFRKHSGLTKGDRVVIAARNYPEWAVAFWATVSIGAVAVPLNAWWTAPELAYAITDSGASVVFADSERFERLQGDIDSFGLKGVVVSRHAGDLPAGVDRWEDLSDRFDRQAALPEVDVAAADIATIMYTSGTTGNPKGAVASHLNHCTNIMNMAFMGALNAEIAGAPAPDPNAPPAAQAASLQVFPFFHIGGLSGLYMAAAFGSKLVTMFKWDIEQAITILAKERITSTSLVPMLLRQLLESPLIDELDTSALGALASGGASVPPDLINKIETKFDTRVAPANGYGLTETTSAVVLNSGVEYFAHPSSIGRPVLVADVRIVDDNGNDCAPDEVGELWVKGPNVVQGYWNKPEATASAFVDGWFRSGDLGHWDRDGFLYVVDRLKDVVIRGGENVYSSEVEAVLFEHPAVADVAIIGLPHPMYGEEVAAVVQLQPGAQATQHELQEFVAARLARFKVPSTIFFRDEPLPRTATGKVLKRDLRNELAAGG